MEKKVHQLQRIDFLSLPHITLQSVNHTLDVYFFFFQWQQSLTQLFISIEDNKEKQQMQRRSHFTINQRFVLCLNGLKNNKKETNCGAKKKIKIQKCRFSAICFFLVCRHHHRRVKGREKKCFIENRKSFHVAA